MMGSRFLFVDIVNKDFMNIVYKFACTPAVLRVFQFFPILTNTWYGYSFILAIVEGVKECFTVVVICPFLMSNGVDHLSCHLPFAICLSYFVKLLFKPFVHLKIEFCPLIDI